MLNFFFNKDNQKPYMTERNKKLNTDPITFTITTLIDNINKQEY